VKSGAGFRPSPPFSAPALRAGEEQPAISSTPVSVIRERFENEYKVNPFLPRSPKRAVKTPAIR
jgi:hypothetical protein